MTNEMPQPPSTDPPNSLQSRLSNLGPSGQESDNSDAANDGLRNPSARVKYPLDLPETEVVLEPPMVDRDRDYDEIFSSRLLFGIHPKQANKPVSPSPMDFCFTLENLLAQPPPAESRAIPHSPVTPPTGRYFPLAPEDGYELMMDNHYQCGRVYVAPYNVTETALHQHRAALKTITTPPHVDPELVDGVFVAKPIPGMVRMIPGIPYAFLFNGDHTRRHTVACAHTLDSLRGYPDYNDILSDAIKLAKLTWGCEASSNSPKISPIFDIFGLKLNDRADARTVFHNDTHDGSFSLANTVMKGEGLGTALPAVQANTSTAHSQIATVLQVLHSLYRRIMPKSISKFEFDIMDFHSNFNNVVSFGGLTPNGTGCQLNVSSLGKSLAEYIGNVQGGWHSDTPDDETRWTLFTLLLRVGPKGDPGPFCLARSGLYLREKDVWIIFLVFKGNDLHSGFAPKEDPDAHQHWVDTTLNDAWNMAGPQNRVGYVNYPGRVPCQRMGSMNMSPPTLFGNYGSSQAHKAKQKNFSQHGLMTLGGQDSYSNRHAREIVYDFWNALQYCDLDLGLDLAAIFNSLSYKDHKTGTSVSLQPLPFHPKHDENFVRHMLSLYAWHEQEERLFFFPLAGSHLSLNRNKTSKPTLRVPRMVTISEETADEMHSEGDTSVDLQLDIESITSQQQRADKIYYLVKLRNQDDGQADTLLEESSPTCVVIVNLMPLQVKTSISLQGNPLLLQFLSKRFPPALCDRNSSTSSRSKNLEQKNQTSFVASIGSQNGLQVPETQRPAIRRAVNSPTLLNLTGAQNPQRLRCHAQATNSQRPFCQTDDFTSQNSLTVQKRKFSRIEDDSEDEESEPETFEVEAILGHKKDESGKYQWHVSWKGYGDTENSWLPEEALSGCLELLANYNSRHQIIDNVVGGLTKKGKRAIKPTTSGPVTLAANLSSLTELFSLSTLQAEVRSIEHRLTLTKPREYYRSMGTGAMVELWGNQFDRSTLLGDLLAVLPASSMHAAYLQFQMLQNAVEILVPMDLAMQKIDVIKRAFRYETCLSLVKVFEWYCTIGSATTQYLLRTYQKHGYQGLHKEAPAFSALVDHIVRYVQSLRDEKEKSRRAPKKQKTNTGSLPKSIVGTEDLSAIPADLYGLRTTAKPGLRMLPQIKGSLLKSGEDALYTASQYCLQELITREIVLPKLKIIDNRLSGPKTLNLASSDLIYQRCITRGAILWSIADVCGTNGIFAASQIDIFLQSPAIIFESPLSDHRKFAPGVLKRTEEILAPLKAWIQSYLDEYPEVSIAAQKLGYYTDHQMAELYEGGPLPTALSEEDLENDERNSDNSHSIHDQANSRKGRKRQFQPRPTNNVSLNLDSLIPPDVQKSFSLGAPAIIIREALNYCRDLLPGDECARRILNGLHPLTSSPTRHNPDHTNPIRELMHGATLLKEHLPASKVTTRQGISNLLSWLGTGQGYVTRNFLKTITRPHFFASSIQDMIETFQAPINANATLIGSQFQHCKPQDIPGYIYYDDQRIWGQPNHYLSVSPSRRNDDGKKFTLEEKFKPYWADSVQDAWAKLLGDLVDQDPTTYTGKRPKWATAFLFLDEINVLTFKSGLTRLQLANYLVTLKIMDPPEPDEVAQWIFHNQSLGAFAGFAGIGFILPSRDLDATRAAFACVFRHLDENLTREDKEILFFGPIFVEHLLCKVGRWKSRFSEYLGMADKLHELVHEALEKDSEWVSGANLHSPKAYPFPSKLDFAWIEAVIADIKLKL